LNHDEMDRDQALRRCEPFQALTDTELRMLASLCLTIHFQSGALLCRRGSSLQRAYVIAEGEVGVFVEGEGRTVQVATYGAGEVFFPSADECARLDRLQRGAPLLRPKQPPG
jgi:CRP-like cAMP-binding protein